MFNKSILVGNLTRNPELRYTSSGTPVSDLSIACNTKHGKDKEEVVFIDVTVWDKLAENCCEYLRKGKRVLVDGRLKEDTWTDKDTGNKRKKYFILANSVVFLSKPGENEKTCEPNCDDANNNIDDTDVPF